MSPLLYRNLSAILLVYDITNKQSFEYLDRWINNIENSADPNVTILLVGTKLDLDSDREVSFEEGYKFAEEYNFRFYEVSSRVGTSVHEMFAEIAANLTSKADQSIICKNAYVKSGVIHLQNQNAYHRSDRCSNLKRWII